MNRKQILKNAKKKNKEKKIVEEDNYVSRFVGTIGLIIIVLVIGYLIFGIFINKTITFNKEKEEEKEEVTIDNSVILVGQLLDQKESDYYVLIFDEKNDKMTLNSWKNLYKEKEGALAFYTVDSKDQLNRSYIVTDGSNKEAKSYSELKIKSPTLIRVQNKNIVGYFEGAEEIIEILK